MPGEEGGDESSTPHDIFAVTSLACEESYTDHPLWSMASLAYYDRALSEDEVAFNHGASDCLELGVRCP